MLDINEQKIIDLLLGENSIPVKLRWKENIDDDYKVLVYLLDKIIEKYKNKEYIPKSYPMLFWIFQIVLIYLKNYTRKQNLII